MFESLTLDSATNLLRWSNRFYVMGATFTLLSAGLVLYAKHAKNQGRVLGWKLITEIVVIVAAFISLCGTVGAIVFGNIAVHFKDLEIQGYETTANQKIAEAHAAAAAAQAETARLSQENIILQKRQGGVENRQRSVEESVAQVNKKMSARTVRLLPSDIEALSSLKGIHVEFVTNMSENNSIPSVFARVLPDVRTAMVGGPSPANPVATAGVHIRHSNDDASRNLAIIVRKIFERNGINADLNVATLYDQHYAFSEIKNAAKGPDVSNSFVLIYLGPNM